MISVEASVEFSMAHRLPAHEGHCRFLHGHNYVLTVQVTKHGEYEDRRVHGMIVDFHSLKETLKEAVSRLDHACMLQESDPLFDILQGQPHVEMKLVTMAEAPTVEALLAGLVTRLNALLAKDWCIVQAARLSETMGCAATYSA